MPSPIALNLVDRGAGEPAIAFLHGFTTDLTDWNAQVEALSDEFRCVALDLPGHGASPTAAAPNPTIESFAAAVNDSLDRLQLKKVVLVGHSMGCRIATETCLQRSERVRGIAYVEGSMLPTADPDAAMQSMAEAIDKAGGMERFIGNLYQHFFVADTPQPVRDFVNARQGRIDPDFARKFFLAFVRWETRCARHLAALRVPVLVLQSTAMSPQLERQFLKAGERTPWMDEVARNVADARIEPILGVGHFTPLEAPERTSELLREFARRFAG